MASDDLKMLLSYNRAVRGKDKVAAENAKYPEQYESELVLRYGSSILLRPIRKGDTGLWVDFVSRLSSHTKYLRFHHFPGKMDEEDASRFCNVDYHHTFAFVAEVTRDREKKIVGIGRYYRLPGKTSAEVAFVIEDRYQGKGIGTGLMERVVTAARDNGITSLEADVLSENDSMMDVFKDYGFHIACDEAGGVCHVTMPITRTRRVTRKEAERERIATIESLKYVLRPGAVAIIGASREPKSIGYLLLAGMLQSGFSGTVYPVNPNAGSVMAVKTYPSVLDIPGEVDLAVIAVPAPLVCRVADECGRKGVRALIVISDGFREVGPEGAAREKELRDIALGHGMRVVGPNCMGVINTEPSIGLHATFAPSQPAPGSVAFLSQSGAMGLVVLEYANNLNIGISTFVSVGNRVDISSNDLLQYWEQDPASRVILLYLESFGNPRKFGRIARRVSRQKPIVVVKGGSTAAGSRAASSHTGALATSDVASDVLFHHAGIIRVNTMEELFNVSTLLSNQPLPQGRRVAIVTNGGGPGIIAADAATRNGLTVPELSRETAEKLEKVVQRDINLNNPVDTTAGATAPEFEGILKVLADDKDNDAVLVIFMPPVVVETRTMEDTIRRIAPLFWKRGKPLLACFLGQWGLKAQLGTRGRYVPTYPFPEEAVAALAKAAEYAEMKRRPPGKLSRITGLKRVKARKIIERAMTRSTQRPLWLAADEIAGLLGCYGIRFVETVLARTPGEAAEAATRLGYPVAVKLASGTITHKTDVGGVVLDLRSAKEVRKAFHDIRKSLTDLGQQQKMAGVTVQPMVPGGLEAIAGVTTDPSFGPLIMFGSGGIYAEMIKDVSLRLHPLTDLDARDLVYSIRMSSLFKGYRGSPPLDTESLQDLLLRISAIVEDIPQLQEMDLNPVKVLPRGKGYRVVDARVMLR
ncbi:GNAT family N-acetyltransferase [Chloroflexota bacterium]